VDGSEPDVPASEYDRQKLAAEHTLLAATESGALRGIVLRLATVYGQGTTPFDVEHGVVSAMLRKAIAGEPLTMWGEGTVARDLICVDDVARAFLAAMDHADALTGRSWLIGTGNATSVRDLFTSIAQAVSSRTGRPAVPVVSVRPDKADASDAVDFVVGSAAFGKVTGWLPTVTLAEGLDRAAAAASR
jgi:dTDP-4-keto-6-deoxyhexose 4-ketoreductase